MSVIINIDEPIDLSTINFGDLSGYTITSAECYVVSCESYPSFILRTSNPNTLKFFTELDLYNHNKNIENAKKIFNNSMDRHNIDIVDRPTYEDYNENFQKYTHLKNKDGKWVPFFVDFTNKCGPVVETAEHYIKSLTSWSSRISEEQIDLLEKAGPRISLNHQNFNLKKCPTKFYEISSDPNAGTNENGSNKDLLEISDEDFCKKTNVKILFVMKFEGKMSMSFRDLNRQSIFWNFEKIVCESSGQE